MQLTTERRLLQRILFKEGGRLGGGRRGAQNKQVKSMINAYSSILGD